MTPTEQEDFKTAILRRGDQIDDYSWEFINGQTQIRITRNSNRKTQTYEYRESNSTAQNPWNFEFEKDLKNGFFD
ncbi:Uncharacterised protein [Legionella lansingensis]|uniref:Uncharacterized protein n=1 Tax=Legionella lansingensis TaxID=45067 RepID=A0A0W0VZG5_9GAMM|nr:hypothetical protein [Legionella lansingensis]KTD25439.1 hypothetical protein Llan_0185 [Legionella lansingensis]SNV51450.1 Uncharacterised protein [Legionella lansingensis]